MKKLLFLIFLTICFQGSFSQKKGDEKKLLQFSGVVVSDGISPVSFASVMIKNSYRGTISDYYGYFSFVAQPGDTIEFRSVGYQDAYYIISDTLMSSRYSLIQLLMRDTINLPEAVIYPWPSKEQFKDAFLNSFVPDDDLERARKNLETQKMMALFSQLPMDGGENYKYSMQQYQSRLYYAGQAPPLNIMNPLAWAKFIEAWKNGDFKQNGY